MSFYRIPPIGRHAKSKIRQKKKRTALPPVDRKRYKRAAVRTLLAYTARLGVLRTYRVTRSAIKPSVNVQRGRLFTLPTLTLFDHGRTGRSSSRMIMSLPNQRVRKYEPGDFQRYRARTRTTRRGFAQLDMVTAR